MPNRPPPLWQRLRTWLATRLGLARGHWHPFNAHAAPARWTGWAWPLAAREWPCALYQPAGLADTDAAPLVLLLHGCKQHARPFAEAAGWVQAADRLRLRLLCPQQVRRANPYGCWNWFHPAAQRGHGELDVMRAALAEARRRWPTTGTWAVGLSAGGGLAALLALHADDDVDAVATVAAPPLLGAANVQDPRDVMKRGLRSAPALAVLGRTRCAPLLIVQGEADDVVHPRCAEQLAEQAHTVLARQHGALHEHASAHGSDWRDADGHLRLRLHRVPGLGHVWSGAPGGHAHVSPEGPDLTALVLNWWQSIQTAHQPA